MPESVETELEHELRRGSAARASFPLTSPVATVGVVPRQSDASFLPKRIPELDGVRGLAILLVLVYHYAYVQIQTAPGSPWAYFMKLFSLTWAGVDLFFVLSGFLIGGILLQNRESPNYFSVFYARRAARIAPLYYLVLLAFVAMMPWLSQAGSGAAAWLSQNPMPLWSYATYLQNFTMAQAGTHGAHWLGVTWSLAVEEQFYLLLPFVIRFVPAKTLPKVCFVLVLAAPVIRTSLYFFHEHQGLPGYVLLPARWDSLLLGVLGAYYVRESKDGAWFKNNQRTLLIILGICLTGSLGFIAANQSIASFAMSVFGHTWLAFLGLTVILLALFAEWPMTRAIFRNRFLIWAGSISYGVYLYHQILSGLFHHFLTGHKPYVANRFDAMVTAMALLATFGLAALSWKFFERPLVRLGQRVRYESAGEARRMTVPQ